MVSDAEIVRRLREILNEADLDVTTEKSIRMQLEREYNIDLSERKKFIRQEVQTYLNERPAYDDDAGQEEEEPQHEEPHKPTRKRKAAKLTKDGKEPKKRTGGGLMKVCGLSDELAALLGAREMPRTDVVKGIWNYIREHNLQDPANKRIIRCDGPLGHLLGTEVTDMFQLNKLLTCHIKSLPGPNGEMPQPKKPKAEPGAGGSRGAFAQPLPMSPQLIRFLNCGETELPRSEVVKRVWAYIKEHDLQDPSNKRNILCDPPMKEMFGVDNFVGFLMTKLLSPHFIKATPPSHDQPAEDSPGDSGDGGHAY
ncbi:hypothetical protein CLOM_g14849 [Closterium sp. NIES-68]|nr:hypothetical protein CLOM_g14849 [Closterium sp. NIES-68]GJP61993.1 hypothetical protein CLOP_g19104 [Closterium sp. NIES-67]